MKQSKKCKLPKYYNEQKSCVHKIEIDIEEKIELNTCHYFDHSFLKCIILIIDFF